MKGIEEKERLEIRFEQGLKGCLLHCDCIVLDNAFDLILRQEKKIRICRIVLEEHLQVRAVSNIERWCTNEFAGLEMFEFFRHCLTS
jgi:hypothetical protein